MIWLLYSSIEPRQGALLFCFCQSTTSLLPKIHPSLSFSLPIHMPSKGVCCGEKAVLVSVYVERPRRELKSNPSRKRHQHHVRGRVINGGRVGGGYDRRAHLLHYSQQLREAARIQSPASTPSNQPLLDSPNNPQHATIVPQAQTNLVQRKQRSSRTPTSCIGDCKALLPKFLRPSVGIEKKEKNGRSTMTKIVATIKNFKVKKKWEYLVKFFSVTQKRS